MYHKPNLLIYSDCFIYGGCENIITNLLSSKTLLESFNVSFVYRYSKAYDQGFKEAVADQGAVKLYPIWLPVLDTQLHFSKIRNKSIIHIGALKAVNTLLALSGLTAIYAAVRIAFLVRRLKPDIIHLNNGGYPAALSVRVAAMASRFTSNKPILMTVNNIAAPSESLLDRIHDRLVSKAVGTVVTGSQAAATAIRKNREALKSDITAIANAVREHNVEFHQQLRDELSVRKEIFLFAAAGHLTDRKGFDVLIRALPVLLRTDVNFFVAIFGEGEKHAHLQSLIDESNLQKHVRLMGHRPNIISLLEDIDVFIAPSIAFEDMPYVLIEAASLGKACIGSNLAGIPEVVLDGVSGIIVPPGDPLQLSKAMSYLMSNKDLLRQYGTAAREIYRTKHTPNDCVMRYMDLYDSLLQRPLPHNKKWCSRLFGKHK